MTERPYDVIDRPEPRGQSVTENGIPVTARGCCTQLNQLTERNEGLAERLWKVNKIIIEYETISKYKDADEVITAIKEVIGLVMLK